MNKNSSLEHSTSMAHRLLTYLRMKLLTILLGTVLLTSSLSLSSLASESAREPQFIEDVTGEQVEVEALPPLRKIQAKEDKGDKSV